MALSLSGVIAEVEAALGDADKAVPALELLLKVAADVKPELPAEDQAIVTEGESIVSALISVITKA
jgi:hypothetical protein